MRDELGRDAPLDGQRNEDVALRLHSHAIRSIAERAASDPVDLSFEEIRALGAAVVAHVRADPRL